MLYLTAVSGKEGKHSSAGEWLKSQLQGRHAARVIAVLVAGVGLGALAALCLTPSQVGSPVASSGPVAIAAPAQVLAAVPVKPTPESSTVPSLAGASVDGALLSGQGPQGPCQRVDEADEWRWSKAKLEPGAKGYAYRSDLSLRHGERWAKCPDQLVPRIRNLADWREAWRRNHPRWKRSPLRKFQRKWSMNVAPSVPLWDLPVHAKSVGLPHAGSIEHGVNPPTAQPEAYPYFIDRDLERTGFSSHALRAMVVAMQGAMDELGEPYKGMQFVILDASMVQGGVMARVSNANKFHSSHQSGRDVDIAIALREYSTGRFYWGHRESSTRLLNRDKGLNRFAKRVGLPSVRQLAKKIRAQDRKRKKKKRRRRSKRKRKTLTATQRARIQLDNKLHRYVYDAIWQLVMHSWFPGNLRWAFLDRPQQKLLHAAARRAGDRDLADAAIAYGGKRRRSFRKHTAVRCVYQPGSKGHDLHVHLRYNCGPGEVLCRD